MRGFMIRMSREYEKSGVRKIVSTKETIAMIRGAFAWKDIQQRELSRGW